MAITHRVARALLRAELWVGVATLCAVLAWIGLPVGSAGWTLLCVDTSRSVWPDDVSKLERALDRLLGELQSSGPLAVFAVADRAALLAAPGHPVTAAELLRKASAEGVIAQRGHNLEACVDAALRQFPMASRVVLVTDGRFEPSTETALRLLASERRVSVEIRAPLVRPPEDVRLELSRSVPVLEAGTAATLAVAVVSTAAAQRSVVLMAGEERIELTLPPLGRQSLELGVVPAGPRWTVRIMAAGGENIDASNDVIELPVRRSGPRRVLILGRGADALQAAFPAPAFAVSTALTWPTRADLCAADLLVLYEVDVHAAELRQDPGALAAAVREAGVGLLVLGAPKAFRGGAYAASPIEAESPLSSRPGEADALEVLIDASGSMESESRLQRAVQALMVLANGVSPAMKLVAFPFAGGLGAPTEEVAAGAFAVRNGAAVDRWTPSGPTEVLASLRELLARPAALERRALLIASDFDDPALDVLDAPLAELATRYAAGVISVVLAPEPLNLERAARLGGRVLAAREGWTPEILLESAAATPFVELETAAALPQDRALLDRVPATVRAYSRTVPSSGAEVVWRTAAGDPLLARSRRGLGRAAALAIDPLRDPAGFALLAGLASELVRRDPTILATLRGDRWLIEALPEVLPGPRLEVVYGAIRSPLEEVRPGTFEGPCSLRPPGVVGLARPEEPPFAEAPVLLGADSEWAPSSGTLSSSGAARAGRNHLLPACAALGAAIVALLVQALFGTTSPRRP